MLRNAYRSLKNVTRYGHSGIHQSLRFFKKRVEFSYLKLYCFIHSMYPKLQVLRDSFCLTSKSVVYNAIDRFMMEQILELPRHFHSSGLKPRVNLKL